MYNNSLIAYFTVVKKKSDVEAVKLDRHFMRRIVHIVL